MVLLGSETEFSDVMSVKLARMHSHKQPHAHIYGASLRKESRDFSDFTPDSEAENSITMVLVSFRVGATKHINYFVVLLRGLKFDFIFTSTITMGISRYRFFPRIERVSILVSVEGNEGNESSQSSDFNHVLAAFNM